ncbi:MAG: non-heme iron oxygenase ferredoxin subunit [Planctomycetota bacterium]
MTRRRVLVESSICRSGRDLTVPSDFYRNDVPYMSDFVFAADESEFADSPLQCFEVEDRFVVIVKLDDGFHCIDDVCTHDGGTLSDGDLDGDCIACSRHGAKFDLRTGEALTLPATEPTVAHETRLEDGKIYVRLNDE